MSDYFNPQPKPEQLKDAALLIFKYQQTSVGFLCRNLGVNRSVGIGIMKLLEDKGIVGPFEGTHRKILSTNLDLLK